MFEILLAFVPSIIILIFGYFYINNKLKIEVNKANGIKIAIVILTLSIIYYIILYYTRENSKEYFDRLFSWIVG